ncbi:TetR/AcrR family transcriptional regulator [Stomatohabitans albus]|uniref:TetR/AcrR family transcriptional regulator n=1 Tax=Stomatohabitans albus TaxID=3110766 RepID=UPI00300D10C3
MPRAFSEHERSMIMTALREAALASLLTKGVRKTTIDDLVRQVNIPKGTFYLFYPNKEYLLFEALTDYGMRVQTELMDELRLAHEHLTPQSLTDILHRFYLRELGTGLIALLTGGELDVLIRKLPDDLVAREVTQDEQMFGLWREVFPSIALPQVQIFSAAFRAIFFVGGYKREIGPHADDALRALIYGLVLQLWSEDD